MPRLRNTATGAVVNISDDMVAKLGDGWEAADAKPAKSPRKPAGKRTSADE